MDWNETIQKHFPRGEFIADPVKEKTMSQYTLLDKCNPHVVFADGTEFVSTRSVWLTANIRPDSKERFTVELLAPQRADDGSEIKGSSIGVIRSHSCDDFRDAVAVFDTYVQDERRRLTVDSGRSIEDDLLVSIVYMEAWLVTHGYRIVSRTQFSAFEQDVPKGLIERSIAHKGDWVIYDPDDNDQGWLLIGDDRRALIRESFNHMTED